MCLLKITVMCSTTLLKYASRHVVEIMIIRGWWTCVNLQREELSGSPPESLWIIHPWVFFFLPLNKECTVSRRQQQQMKSSSGRDDGFVSTEADGKEVCDSKCHSDKNNQSWGTQSCGVWSWDSLHSMKQSLSCRREQSPKSTTAKTAALCRRWPHHSLIHSSSFTTSSGEGGVTPWTDLWAITGSHMEIINIHTYTPKKTRRELHTERSAVRGEDQTTALFIVRLKHKPLCYPVANVFSLRL